MLGNYFEMNLLNSITIVEHNPDCSEKPFAMRILKMKQDLQKLETKSRKQVFI